VNKPAFAASSFARLLAHSLIHYICPLGIFRALSPDCPCRTSQKSPRPSLQTHLQNKLRDPSQRLQIRDILGERTHPLTH
jgi:hypothetical protein